MTDNSSQPRNETPTSPSVDDETLRNKIEDLLCEGNCKNVGYCNGSEKSWCVDKADDILAALSRSEAAVAWQMRVRGDNGSWFAWDGVDQDEYNLYQKTPTDGAEVRALYAAPSPDTRVREALDRIPAHLNFLIGRGKTRPDEPPYGVQILDGLEIVAEAEGDDLCATINAALAGKDGA